MLFHSGNSNRSFDFFPGDLATIQRVAQLNLVASNPSYPSAILETFNCSRDVCEEGKSKDATYIMKKFLPVMLEIDPKREMIDHVSFDGASNVQLAGKLLEEHFPRATADVGIEHTTSLVFEKFFKEEPFQVFSAFAKIVSNVVQLFFLNDPLTIDLLLSQVRNLFGAQRHVLSAVFAKEAREEFDGQPVGFIKPSECRMAGEGLQLCRLLRLKKVIQRVVTSKVFLEQKKWTTEAEILMDPLFWEALMACCNFLLPLYLIVRQADKTLGGIDKIQFYVLQFERLFQANIDAFCDAYELAEDVIDKMKGCNKNYKAGQYKIRKKAVGKGKQKTEGLDGESWLAMILLQPF